MLKNRREMVSVPVLIFKDLTDPSMGLKPGQYLELGMVELGDTYLNDSGFLSVCATDFSVGKIKLIVRNPEEVSE